MAKLIAVTGQARSGKDSFAAICAKYGYTRIAFADPLKVITAHIAGEPSHLFFDELSKEEFSDTLGMTRRQALQKVGQAVRESLGKDAWVKRAMQEWVSSGLRPTVLSDCRYPNEAQAVRELGGVVVQVVRPGSGLSGEAAQHESEKQISDDLIDVVINNDGTLGDLAVEVRKIINMINFAHNEGVAV